VNNQICNQCVNECKQNEKSILLHCKNYKQKPVQTTLKFNDSKVNNNNNNSISKQK
jgi:hypothetical protein